MKIFLFYWLICYLAINMQFSKIRGLIGKKKKPNSLNFPGS